MGFSHIKTWIKMKLRLYRIRYRMIKLAIAFLTGFSFVFILSNLFLIRHTDWLEESWITYASQKLDTRFLSVRAFLSLQEARIHKHDDQWVALQEVDNMERRTGNAYSIGSDSDFELDRNRFWWIFPTEKQTLISRAHIYNNVLIQLRTALTKLDSQKQRIAKQDLQINSNKTSADPFQTIVNQTLANKKILKIVFLIEGFSFARLGREEDIISIFLGWTRSRNNVTDDPFGTEKFENANIFPYTGQNIKFYPCTASGIHQQFSKTRDKPSLYGNYSCQSDLNVLSSPSVTFDTRFFTYHDLRHNLVVRTSHPSRDTQIARDEWDVSCMYCHKYPNFMTYVHVIHDGVMDTSGVIYTKNLKIIPLMWVEHKAIDAEHYGSMVGMYRFLQKEQLFTMAENLCTLPPTLQNINSTQVNKVEEVFSITVQFSYVNFGHALLESFTRLSMYVDFLKRFPYIPIHVGNVEIIQPYLPIFGIQNRLISGLTIAKRIYLPEGNAPYFPSVHYLHATSFYIHKFISNLHTKYGSTAKQDTIIYVRRLFRRPLKQDATVRTFLMELAERSKLEYREFTDDERSNSNVNSTMVLFNKAVLVFGAHGAGLSNIIFSQSNTSVIEIMCPPPWTASTFRQLTYKLGMRYHSIMGHPVDGIDPLSDRPSSVHCDKGLKIHNMDEFKRSVETILQITLGSMH